MKFLVDVLIFFVALEHLWFLVLEMFLWRKPLGRRVFKTTQEFADASAVLAANQGLYNGFLAAGLVWGLWTGSAATRSFFLACVVIAGLFGGATVNPRIALVQAVPAALALLLLLASVP